MDQNVPLASLLTVLRSNGRDPIAALRGDSDPVAALMGNFSPLATLLASNPLIKQMAPAQARAAMYQLSAGVGTQTP